MSAAETIFFKSNSIDYSESANWDEFIQVTFIGEQNSYISFSSIIYEQDVQIEFSRQGSFIKLLKKDLKCVYEPSKIVFDIDHIIVSSTEINCRTIEINLPEEGGTHSFSGAFTALVNFVPEI